MQIKKAIWKFPYNKLSYFIGKDNNYMMDRNITLTSKYLNKLCKCHKGNVYGKLRILKQHLGHKLGEFFPTKIMGARIAYRKKLKKMLKGKKKGLKKK